jgi:mannose-6-phosphate isomerase
VPVEPQNYVEKLWGTEHWLVNNSHYCGKILTLAPGWMCSLHYHPVKTETFYCLGGAVRLEVHEKGAPAEYKVILLAGDAYTIPAATPHRFQALYGKQAKLLEISTPHSDEDVVRLEDSRES